MFLSADWIINDDDQSMQESELFIKSGVMNEAHYYVSLSLLDNRCRYQGMQESELLIKSGVMNLVHYYVPLSRLYNR